MRRIPPVPDEPLGNDFYTGSNSWIAAKQIDPAPGEWTYPLFSYRAHRFHVQDSIFYEELPEVSHLETVCELNERLLAVGVEPGGLNRVALVTQVFRSIQRQGFRRVPLPARGEAMIGWHHMVIIGREGLDYVVGNTWGEEWGHNGSARISTEYLKRFLVQGWLVREGRKGVRPDSHASFRDATGSDLYELWHEPAPVTSGRLFDGLSYRVWTQVSLPYEAPVDVIEIRRPGSVRVAWCHLVHLRGTPPKSVATEFFVWPTRRRQGVGTALAAVAADRAAGRGSSAFRLLVDEADHYKASAQAAVAFAAAQGLSPVGPDPSLRHRLTKAQFQKTL